MKRLSQCTGRITFAYALAVLAEMLALFLALCPAYAQRGGGGHGGGGGHMGGGSHMGGAHFGGARAAGGHMGAGHFAAGMRGPRVARGPYGTRYLTYRSVAHRSFFNSSSRGSLSHNVPFTGPFSRFGDRFGSRRGFYGNWFGYWPLWDWDFGLGWDCDFYDSGCNYGAGAPGYPVSREDSDYELDSEAAARPGIVVYLHDGSGYRALDYWLTNGNFYIETTYGAEKSFPLDQVDLKRTFADNAARGITFTVTPYPSASDPGPMFAPDSYAPDCPVPSTAASGASSPATGQSTGTGQAGSWFGVAGSAMDRGLSVNEVRPNSPAAMIGVQPGDVVVRVNCQQIHTAQDVQSVLDRSSGPIWVSFMIRGAWLTDKKIAR